MTSDQEDFDTRELENAFSVFLFLLGAVPFVWVVFSFLYFKDTNTPEKVYFTTTVAVAPACALSAHFLGYTMVNCALGHVLMSSLYLSYSFCVSL